MYSANRTREVKRNLISANDRWFINCESVADVRICTILVRLFSTSLDLLYSQHDRKLHCWKLNWIARGHSNKFVYVFSRNVSAMRMMTVRWLLLSLFFIKQTSLRPPQKPQAIVQKHYFSTTWSSSSSCWLNSSCLINSCFLSIIRSDNVFFLPLYSWFTTKLSLSRSLFVFVLI